MRQRLEEYTVPDLWQIESRPGQPTDAFRRFYEQELQKALDVFPPDSNAWRYKVGYEDHKKPAPPNTAKDFLQQKYRPATAFRQRIAHEIFTVLHTLAQNSWNIRYDEGGNVVLTEPQQVLATHTALAVTEGDVLTRGDFGMGKTYPGINVPLRAFRNYQVREAQGGRVPLMGGIMAARPNILVQNTKGEQRFNDSPPFKIEPRDASRYYTYCCEYFGPAFKQCMKLGTWKKIFETVPEDRAAAEKRIRECMRAENGANIIDASVWKHMSETMVALLMRESVMMKKSIVDSRAQPVPLAEDMRSRERNSGQLGDMLAGFDRQFPFVVSNMEFNLDPDRKAAKDWDPDNPDWIYLMREQFLTGRNALNADMKMFTRNAQILPKVGGLFVDDAMQFGPGQLKKNVHKDAVVFAVGEENVRAGWEQSPYLDDVRAQTLGYSPHKGFAGYPGVDKKVFKPKTLGAMQAFLDDHFAHDANAEKLGQKQPFLCNALVYTAPGEDLREYARETKARYAERGIEAEVYCYDGKSAEEKPMLEQKLQQWSEHPVVVFTTELEAAKGLSLHGLELVTIAHPFRRGDLDNRRQAASRTNHSTLYLLGDDTKGQKRVYVKEQTFRRDDQPLLTRSAAELGVTSLESADTHFPWPSLQRTDRAGFDEDRTVLDQDSGTLIPAPMHPSVARKLPKPDPSDPLSQHYTNPAILQRDWKRRRSRRKRELRAERDDLDAIEAILDVEFPPSQMPGQLREPLGVLKARELYPKNEMVRTLIEQAKARQKAQATKGNEPTSKKKKKKARKRGDNRSNAGANAADSQRAALLEMARHIVEEEVARCYRDRGVPAAIKNRFNFMTRSVAHELESSMAAAASVGSESTGVPEAGQRSARVEVRRIIQTNDKSAQVSIPNGYDDDDDDLDDDD